MSAHSQEELLALAASTTGVASAPNEVLTLQLGAEEYGIDILRVQEIRSYEQPTRIAGALPHVLGVTNLRGVIGPIVDLRSLFGLDPVFDSGTATVVLGMGRRTVGALVDAVSEVAALQPPQIKPAPGFNAGVATTCITVIATLGQGNSARMLILLDIASLMAEQRIGVGGETAPA